TDGARSLSLFARGGAHSRRLRRAHFFRLQHLDGPLQRAVAPPPEVFARGRDQKVGAKPLAFQTRAASRVVVHLADVEDAAVRERVALAYAEHAAARRLADDARAPRLAKRRGEDLGGARRPRVRDEDDGAAEARERDGGRDE